MKKRLALFNIVLLSGSIHAQGVILNCQQDSALLFPKQTLSTDENLNVVADQSEITKKDQYLLTGNVSLNSSKYYLAADRINIKKSNKTSSATGHVKFQDHDLMMIAEKAFVQKKDDTTYTTLDQIKFHYPESKINGEAQKIVNNGIEQVFDSSTYSLCPIGNTDWRMKANKITLNTTENLGVAEDVTVEFFGVPIFYSPGHTWALEGRGSGFLSPTFGTYNDSNSSSNSNYQVRIPYYFNIAPDRDFLLSLNQLSSRGSVLEGKYRQLIAGGENWDGGRFEVEGHYLYKDDITNQDRWLLNSKLDLTLNKRVKLNIVTDRVSDVQYFKQIEHNNTSISSLDSHANLSYDDEKRNLRFSLFSESNQLINSDSETYTRAPEVLISKDIKALGGRNINLSVLSTKFAHKDPAKDTGVRTHSQINFARTIRNNSYTLTPSLNISNTDYAMDDVTNKNRSIARFGLDSKLFLERETRLFNRDVIQTLTPRLAYNYTPIKDQSSLPIFDSEVKTDSYENLFSGQKFTGIDRINNANDITIGFESEFIDEETG
ncbi:MAG: LPS assembly protein LptD, partial [Gammaproteobacteria bacterium]|nr:LPS assembly protein LptD [Gammaproteobacteria bacterium]